jgi:hypothetical protein
MSWKSLPSHVSLQIFIVVTFQIVASDSEDGSSIVLQNMESTYKTKFITIQKSTNCKLSSVIQNCSTIKYGVFITMTSVAPLFWATTADQSSCGCTWQTQTQFPLIRITIDSQNTTTSSCILTVNGNPNYTSNPTGMNHLKTVSF